MQQIRIRQTTVCLITLAIAGTLVTGCSSSTQQAAAAKPYWAGGQKPMTPVQAAEAYTYASYRPAAPAAAATSTAPPDGRSEYEAFVNGGQK